MLKKIISVIISVLFIINSTFATIEFWWNNENTNYNTIWEVNKQIIMSTLKIKKIKWWDLYLSKLWTIETIINSAENLETLNLMTELNNQKNINNTKLRSSDNTSYEIYKLIDLKIKKRTIQIEEEKYNNIISLVNKPWISKEEIKKVEDEIVKLQLTLLDNSKSIVEKILKNINDNLNYEDNWNIKFDFEWNSTNFWSWKVTFNMPNYKINNEKFDSELQSQIDLLIETSLIWKESFKIQFSSFVDFITKDSNMYLLMNKLKYSWIEKIDDTWEIEKVFKKLKLFASNNEYLKMEQDVNWWNTGVKEIQYALNLYKNFKISDINSIYNKWQDILKSPMFKVYKKNWNKYLIIPSKEACDTIMSLQYKFKWIWNLHCSDNEYYNMVKEIVEKWNIYIILWRNLNTIWFDLLENPQVSLNAKLDYSDTKIENLNLKVTPKDEKYAWEFIELDFVNWKKLDILFNAKSDDIDLSFKSLLDKDNYFTNIDYIWNFSRNLNTSFKLENGSFKWNFDSKKDWYDYNSGKAIEWNYVYKWSLTWTIKEHKVNWFNFEASWKDAIKNQDILLLKLKLINNIITWTIKVYDINEEILNIVTTWKYDKDIFELNNKISFKNIFKKQEKKENTDNTIKSNLNFKYYWDIYNYNREMNFDVYISNKDYIKWKLTSDNKRIKTETLKIKKPSNIKTVDDLE